MPEYSFIIPVYNCGGYLDECLASILAQTVRDFEILLIDDGSTDGSGAKCDEYARKYPFIRCFHKENGGASSARNVGIDNARGEYLLFIDGDDTIARDTLKRIGDLLTEDTGMVVFGMAFDYYAAPEGEILRTEKKSCAYRGSADTGTILREFDGFFNDNALSSACNKVFRRSVIESCGLRFRESMRLYEDLEFVLRYLAHISSASFAAEPLYHYRLMDKGAHLAARVADIHRMSDDLCFVEDGITSLALTCPEGNLGCLNTGADLYLQWLSIHFSFFRCPRRKLAGLLTEYLGKADFRRVLSLGGKLNEGNQKMLRLADGGKYGILHWNLFLRRIKKRLRTAAKKILKFLKLR